MRNLLRFSRFSAIFPVFLGLAVFLTPSPSVGEEILPLDKIKPGMKGTGKTAFRKTEIITFTIEVIDILRNWLPGQDVILVRCGGEEVGKTGIASGMSGSPCYIGGKLIGALAYTWPWSSEPIAGITPIESMLAISKRPLEKKVDRTFRGKAGYGLQPIETPLFVSSRSARALEFLRKKCEGFHLHPMGGGPSGGAFRDLDAKLEPGAAIGILLMEGDMEAYAVGTVTHVDGDKVLAFGHPFLMEGEVSLPITNAWTYTVISRLPGSFKMSATGKTLGALVQDRQAGILGRIGGTAPLIPMSVKVRNPRVKAETTYSIRIARHKSLTPIIASFALRDAMDAAEPGPGETAQEVVLTFKPEKYDEVSIRMFFSKDQGWWGRNFMAPLMLFLNNPFEETAVEKIQIDAEIVHEGRTGELTGLKFDKREYVSGETVDLHVEITPFRKKPFWFHLPFDLPETLEPGKYTIDIVPGDEAPMTEEAPIPEDVATLLKAMKTLNIQRADRLVAVLDRPGFILQHKGKRYFDLPLSALYGLLPPLESGGFRMARRYWKSEAKKVGLFLAGNRSATIRIKENLTGD